MSVEKKLKKVKSYRLYRNIEINVKQYIENMDNFSYIKIKNFVDNIMEEQNINYTIEYNYDITEDEIIIKLENDFLIQIKKQNKLYSA